MKSPVPIPLTDSARLMWNLDDVRGFLIAAPPAALLYAATSCLLMGVLGLVMGRRILNWQQQALSRSERVESPARLLFLGLPINSAVWILQTAILGIFFVLIGLALLAYIVAAGMKEQQAIPPLTLQAGGGVFLRNVLLAVSLLFVLATARLLELKIRALSRVMYWISATVAGLSLVGATLSPGTSLGVISSYGAIIGAASLLLNAALRRRN